jgi:uncharacterized membrane protein YeaQ/YmgE (transglycosylase-associated protein family)
MTILELIVCLAIGGVCGAAACILAGDTTGGFVISALVGFVGAFVGHWLAHELHLPPLLVVTIDGRAFALLWPFVGGSVVVAGAKLLMRPHDVAHLDRYEQ